MTMTQLTMERDKAALEAIEAQTLAPYACRSAGARRRHRTDDAVRTLAYRTEFQRDRDRILHAQAFRRLKHKTQVYVAYEGDHHRTRLTHTLEVAQVARTIGRALGLNEDLVEAIAIGHDVGQPPFGAAGVEVLAGIMAGSTRIPWVSPETLKATGGFEPGNQGLRVVDRLERRYEHPGINLTDPVREGIWKCGQLDTEVSYPDLVLEGLEPEQPPSLEAQTVRAADRLARLAHDIEDGIRGGEVALTDLERVAIGRAVAQKLGSAYPRDPYERRHAQIRGLIHLLVSDVVVHASAALHAWEEANPRQAALLPPADAPSRQAALPVDDEAALPPPRLALGTLGFSERIEPMVDELEDLAATHIYRSRTVRRLDARARTFLTGLFAAYYQDPLQLDDYALHRYRAQAGGSFLRDVPEERVDAEISTRYHDRPAFLRIIADHVAGMSDTYALKEYERLYLPFPERQRPS